MGQSQGEISTAWEIADYQDDIKEQRLDRATHEAKDVVDLMGRIGDWA